MKSLAFAIREMEPTRVIVVYDGAGGGSKRKKKNSNLAIKQIVLLNELLNLMLLIH